MSLLRSETTVTMRQPNNRLEKPRFRIQILSRPNLFSINLLGIVLLGQIGCASVVSHKRYPVVIDNTKGSTFFSIQDRKNQVVHQGITPEQVTLSAKSMPFFPAKYSVVFAGHESTTQTRELKAGFDPWVAGNVLLNGGLGVVVDGFTGAMFKLPQRVAGDIPEKFAIKDSGMGKYIAQAAISGSSNPMNEAIVAATPSQDPVPITTATVTETPPQPNIRMASSQDTPATLTTDTNTVRR